MLILTPILFSLTLAHILLFTGKYPVTIFIWLVTTGASILIGYGCERLGSSIWYMTMSDIGALIWFPIGMVVILPITMGTICLLAAHLSCFSDVSRRIVVGLIGVAHMAWHAGYIVGPCILIIASILPSVAADYIMYNGTILGSLSGLISYKKEIRKESQMTLIYIP
jgi:hypothetical protein